MPIPKDMLFLPPICSIIFLLIYCPSPMKMASGSTKDSKKLKMGEPWSLTLSKVAPASCSRSVRVGSYMAPVW